MGSDEPGATRIRTDGSLGVRKWATRKPICRLGTQGRGGRPGGKEFFGRVHREFNGKSSLYIKLEKKRVM